MFSIGQTIGAFIAIAILSAIIERLAFKGQPPLQRAALTVGVAFGLASVLAGFGMADGGPFVWTAGLNYLPGAVLVFFWYYTRYGNAWTSDDERALDSGE